MPGSGGTMGFEPRARIKASGCSAATYAAVTGVLRRISTPSSRACRSKERPSSYISRLNGMACSLLRMPPTWSDLSHRMTSWPRCAAVMAALRPATPAPATRTFFRQAAGITSIPSNSRPTSGFTAQRRVKVVGRSAMQVKQRRHFTIRSSRPASTFCGRNGSARSSRAM